MLSRIITRIVSVAGTLASIILIYVTAHTLFEICLRTLTGRSTAVVVEFVGYGLAAITYLALADTMRSGSLVRVNNLLQFAPRSVRRVLDAFCLLLTLAVTLFITWFFWLDLQRSYLRDIETDSVIPLPMWLPPLGLVLGLVVFAVDLAWHILLVLRGTIQLADNSSEGV